MYSASAVSRSTLNSACCSLAFGEALTQLPPSWAVPFGMSPSLPATFSAGRHYGTVHSAGQPEPLTLFHGATTTAATEHILERGFSALTSSSAAVALTFATPSLPSALQFATVHGTVSGRHTRLLFEITVVCGCSPMRHTLPPESVVGGYLFRDALMDDDIVYQTTSRDADTSPSFAMVFSDDDMTPCYAVPPSLITSWRLVAVVDE
jgi:hypothetical protein